ncbi:hypothetical protein LAZ67_18001858 [Cordylochernes scorpioides]|uniref:Uncharacterized protein n=1 Tax=Cordylochernes scorpioides TaxID=51811 RepID=A0ABY6LIX3_9ARAC|nr:hypothetical protein LAZ67_18001858 [Cordylochernes scorpioides]
MVGVGVCASNDTLVFVDEGAKINQEVYRRDMHEAGVLQLGRLTYQLHTMDFLYVMVLPTLLKECVRRLVLRRRLQFDVALNTLDLVAAQTFLW